MTNITAEEFFQAGWQHNSVVGQAIIRLSFGFVFTLYAWFAWSNQIFGSPSFEVVNAGIVFNILASCWLMNVGFVPSDTRLFKVGGMILDISFATYTMTIGGTTMVFAYGIFLWIIIGNGLRFGRDYMFLANLLSIVGFSIVLMFGEFWQQYPYIGGGLLFWLILMPLYIGKLLRKLELAVAQAEKANIAKSRFLANMSHEIRTPLTSIIGYSQNALDEYQTPEEQTHSLQIISQSGKHLLKLINDILDFSKIEAGELEMEVLRVNPLHLINEMETIIRPEAEKKGLTFEIDYHFPLPAEIKCDPVRLQQILLNLCNNAVKFTEKGSVQIKVDYLAEENILSFVIRDTGIGISEEEMKHIFKPFKQADSCTTRKYGGTGLGLSLSLQLTQLLGGELTADSVENEGTTFLLQIPCGDNNKTLVNGFFDIDDPAQTTDKQANPRLSGRILLAEDNEVNQQLMTAFLQRMGASVTVAHDGSEAVDIALNNSFDLVLMDMQMPVMSGIDATLELRENDYDIPVVAVTANATRHDKELCKQSGFSDFITKPISYETLYEIVAKYLQVASDSEKSQITAV